MGKLEEICGFVFMTSLVVFSIIYLFWTQGEVNEEY